MAVVLVSIALVGPWQANSWIIIESGPLSGIGRQVWGIWMLMRTMRNTAIQEELRREIIMCCIMFVFVCCVMYVFVCCVMYVYLCCVMYICVLCHVCIPVVFRYYLLSAEIVFNAFTHCKK